MKPDIIRQPLLLAIASILVVIAAAMTTGTTISPAPETMISTPLGDLIGLFQERFPRCSRILCGGLLLLTGILCGRLAVRYGLYPVSSTLTIPLYGLVACGILLGQGANPLDTPAGLWHSFVSDSGYRIFANTPPLVPALLGIVLFIVLCAIFFGLISFRTVSIKARGMLTYTILLFTVTGCLIAVPSVTPGLLAVAAVPAALLMPLTFIRIQRTVGTLLYLILYITCIVNILQ